MVFCENKERKKERKKNNFHVFKSFPQDSFIPVLVMILTIFFCKINSFLTLEDLPPKIIPYLKMECILA